MGIHQMKGKLLIAETFRLFDDSSPQHLFGSHSISSTLPMDDTVSKVLQNHLCDGRNSVKNLADLVQFSGPGVLKAGRYQGHLNLILFAHFLVVPFPVCVVILVACTSFITTSRPICPP
jgi:hypothetical protein